jgi:hypothetical protein
MDFLGLDWDIVGVEDLWFHVSQVFWQWVKGCTLFFIKAIDSRVDWFCGMGLVDMENVRIWDNQGSWGNG